MLAGLRHALSHPVTGPVALAVALVLAMAYGVSASMWQAERTAYEARIVQLTQASETAQDSLRTDLASCQAEAARQVTEVGYAAADAAPAGARRLLEQQPEGIDACARMESADRAVLSNLER